MMNKAIRNVLDRTLELIAICLLTFMVILVSWQIITRYVLNNPSTKSEDLLIYSFVWCALFGMAYVFGRRDHIAMVFFKEKLVHRNPKIKKMMDAGIEIIIMIFAVAVLVFGGLSISELAMGQISPALGVPMGYLYLALPISGIITIIYNILNLMDIIGGNE